MIKITIQSVSGADYFKFKEYPSEFFESKTKSYELYRNKNSNEDGNKILFSARNVNSGEYLFSNVAVEEVAVDGVTYPNYENLSAVLTPILFKKGGGTGGGGTGSLTASITSDVTEGGITAGQVFSAGTTNQQMWEKFLSKTYQPVLSNNSFSLSDISNREVGTSSAISVTGTYTRGTISGTNITTIPRYGAATEYFFNGVSNGTSNTKSLTGITTVSGANTVTASVNYGVGNQPLDSKGNPVGSPTSAGSLSTSKSFTGLYPYFYGVIEPEQTIDDVVLSNLTKVVGVSTGDISLPYSGVLSKRLVVVVPSASATKTKWFVNALNSGNIGNPGDVFPSVLTRNYDSPNSLWTNQSFKVYISESTSLDTTIQLQN